VLPLACIVDLFEDATRFAKALVAFFVGSMAVGISFQAKHMVNEELRQVTKHSGLVSLFSNFYTFSFSIMYLVNAMCVIYSILGLACVREMIFREREKESKRCRIIQCCLGNCFATYSQFAVTSTLCLQVGLSYAYLLFSICLGILVGMCNGGNAVIRVFQELLDTFSQSGGATKGWSPFNWFMNVDIEQYRLATHGMESAAMQCFVGCLLSVASQALMLIVISEEKGRIEGTMAEGAWNPSLKSKKRRTDDDDSDASSTSSSDSDYEPSPVLYYQKRSQFGAKGPNYKLPAPRYTHNGRSIQ